MMIKNKIKIFFTVIALTFSTLAMFQNCGAPSHTWSTTELSSHHTDEDHWEKPEIKTNYMPNLADRYYIMSILIDVFGPSTVSVDTSSGSKIYSKLTEFGTPCSMYEDYRIGSGITVSGTTARKDRPCLFGDRPDSANANIISTATANRQGYMINTCTALIENSTTLKHALTKINGGTYSGSAPPVSRTKLGNLYANFYRGRPSAAPGVLDSLEIIFQYETDLTKAWKAAIYAVCASDHWQEL